MFNGDSKRVTRETAILKMQNENGCHALYGLSYDGIEELAADEDEIMVFKRDEDFYKQIEEIRLEYEKYGLQPMFLAVHERR